MYFDNAATTLKPRSVINAVCEYYERYTSNVARGEHRFAERVTTAFEATREKVASFISAKVNEITFTFSCTDSINLVSSFLALQADDEIIVSVLEHHSNYLPWRSKARVSSIPLDSDGIIDLERLKQSLTPKTRLVAMSWVSNVTGNVQPIAEVVRIAHEHGCYVLVDAAQAAGHFPIDVTALGCDFLAFSAHKMLGPSGVGVLYLKEALHEGLPPVRYGGGMVNKVLHDDVIFHNGPTRYEAGTPNIEGILAFGAAIDYLVQHGMGAIHEHLHQLEQYAWEQLSELDGIVFPFARAPEHVPIFTFRPRQNTLDLRYLARLLSDSYDIAVTSGYQCCQPFYDATGVAGALRASLYLYNTTEEIDRLVKALQELRPFLV
ncbi:aminotransferase class V-fold PLP-dependent enzyme [Haliangium ochraceum]|uniref:aminotransferase class V-fold PLP-dependent enzyme n=1 Tax=Haliangium ochraceum TaxID=80816 RepID=UPI00019BAACD|nr:cysteine desulfurase [Haliangium ochraceum]